MTEPTPKPVIFLPETSGQDREDKVGYLRNLPIELNGIRKALQKARQAGLCEVVERANTTVDNILDVFQEYRDRVAIFHYGGHAGGSYELLLESASGEQCCFSPGRQVIDMRPFHSVYFANCVRATKARCNGYCRACRTASSQNADSREVTIELTESQVLGEGQPGMSKFILTRSN